MRKGFHSLAAQVQTALQHDPYSGALYIFRGRKGDLVKILFWDRQGMCLYAKKLDRGRFIWPQAKEGVVSLTMAQLKVLWTRRQAPPIAADGAIRDMDVRVILIVVPDHDPVVFAPPFDFRCFRTDRARIH